MNFQPQKVHNKISLETAPLPSPPSYTSLGVFSLLFLLHGPVFLPIILPMKTLITTLHSWNSLVFESLNSYYCLSLWNLIMFYKHSQHPFLRLAERSVCVQSPSPGSERGCPEAAASRSVHLPPFPPLSLLLLSVHSQCLYHSAFSSFLTSLSILTTHVQNRLLEE